MRRGRPRQAVVADITLKQREQKREYYQRKKAQRVLGGETPNQAWRRRAEESQRRILERYT